jgi:dihydroorotase
VDIRLLDPTECVRVISEHRDLIVGVKVRVGRVASGANGVAPLDMAVEVAEETGLPVMAHLDHPPPTRKEVLSRLRPGDVLTHCFKPFPNAPAALRRRGLGRGQSRRGAWRVLRPRPRRRIVRVRRGEGMLAKGLRARLSSRAMSTRLNIDGPVFDLMATLSKFLLPWPRSSRRWCGPRTSAPAAALRRPDLGSLASSGSTGDATSFAIEQGQFDFTDCAGRRSCAGSIGWRAAGSCKRSLVARLNRCTLN